MMMMTMTTMMTTMIMMMTTIIMIIGMSMGDYADDKAMTWMQRQQQQLAIVVVAAVAVVGCRINLELLNTSSNFNPKTHSTKSLRKLSASSGQRDRILITRSDSFFWSQ